MQQHITLSALASLIVVGGCMQPKGPMGPPERPQVAPEMAKLEPFIGEWTGDAEMVSPTAEEMRAMMPEGADDTEAKSTFKGDNSNRWALGGMFMVGEGWHEMGPDEKLSYTEYWTWDAKAGKFRTFYFTDWGEVGTGWATVSEDGKNFTVKATGSNYAGEKSSGEGSLTFLDANTMEWRWAETGPMGRMEFKGVSKKK